MSEQLQFADYTSVRTSEPTGERHDVALSDDDDNDALYFAGNDDGKRKLLRAEGDDEKPRSQPSLFTMEYFQRYFDVDTDQVLTRLAYSCWPNPQKGFIETHIRPNPDFYGPLWACVTLVFAVGMCANVADYVTAMAEGRHMQWHYDFHMVTMAATLVSVYVLCAPGLLYTLLWYKDVDCAFSMAELLSAYGYSVTVFVPASLCLVVNVSLVRWLALSIAAAASGATLVFALRPTLSRAPKAVFTLSVAAVLVGHAMFTVFLGLAFSASSANSAIATATTSIPVASTAGAATSAAA